MTCYLPKQTCSQIELLVFRFRSSVWSWLLPDRSGRSPQLPSLCIIRVCVQAAESSSASSSSPPGACCRTSWLWPWCRSETPRYGEHFRRSFGTLVTLNSIILQEIPSADSPFVCQGGKPECLGNMIEVIAICQFQKFQNNAKKTRCRWTERSRPAGLHRPFEWPLGPADHLLHGVSCWPPGRRPSCECGCAADRVPPTMPLTSLSCCVSVCSCTLPPSPGPPLTRAWWEAWDTGWCTPTLPWPERWAPPTHIYPGSLSMG